MTTAATLDVARLAALAQARRAEFTAATPFPHVVIDDFLHAETAAALLGEFDVPDEGWTFLHHFNEHKRIFTAAERMGPVSRAVFAELQSPAVLAALQTLTGVAGLLGDPDLDGGGLHETPPGGFLNVHADFQSHTRQRHWRRELNLILFLSPDWREEYGGHLELWDAEVRHCVRRILPRANRAVLFRVGPHAFHGVPGGVHCPPGQTRKSLAVYYFSADPTPRPLAPTHYVPRPDDPPARRALIRVDGWMVYAYSLLKRYAGLDDARTGKLLRRLFGTRRR